MNVQITHVIVHEPAQVRELLAEATKIADELTAGSDMWEATFREACRLLGQRYTFAAAQPEVSLGDLTRPAMGIPRGNRH